MSSMHPGQAAHSRHSKPAQLPAPGEAQHRRKGKLHPEEQQAVITGREPGRDFLLDTCWGKVTCPKGRPLWVPSCPLAAHSGLDPSPQLWWEAAGRKAALRKQRENCDCLILPGGAKMPQSWVLSTLGSLFISIHTLHADPKL